MLKRILDRRCKKRQIFVIMNLAVPRLGRIEQRGFLIKLLLLKRSSASWRCLYWLRDVGQGLSPGGCFSFSHAVLASAQAGKNADVALRMQVLGFIAINESWLKGIDSCLGTLMREFSRRIPLFQGSLTCQPQTVHRLTYCLSSLSVEKHYNAMLLLGRYVLN